MGQGQLDPSRLEQLQYIGQRVQDLLAAYPVPAAYLDQPTLYGLFSQISVIESFFGISLTEVVGFSWPALVVPVLAVLTGAATAFLTMKMSTASVTDERIRMQQRIMMFTMPIMMGVITIGMPGGVGIFWITSSVFHIAQQYVFNRRAGIKMFEKNAPAT